MIQTIKNTKDMPKSKDKTHSDYVRELNDYRNRVTEIQKWIAKEKDMITITMKMDSHTGINIDFDRLAMLRNEAKFLTKQIKTLKTKIKDHQKANSNSTPYHYRMYAMVLRQLSPMQKGIQSLHAVVEYGEKVKSGNIDANIKKAYNKWAKEDKTMIVLDAGTSVDLINAIYELIQLNVPHAVFYEEDLYGMNTVVCFLADERVWDTKKYPSYEQHLAEFNSKLNDAYTSLFDTSVKAVFDVHIPPTREQWQAATFGTVDPEPIMKLRELIFSKKLSM